MEQLDILWDYQKLDIKADELVAKKKSSAARRKLSKAIKYLKAEQNSLVKLTNDIDKKNHIYNRLSHDFESIDKELGEEEGALKSGSIKTLKELDSIEQRIALAEEKLDTKRKELEFLAGEVESLNKKLKQVTIGLRKGKKEYDKFKQQYDHETQDIDEEFSKIKENRDALKGQLSQSLFKKYKAARGKHTNAMAEIYDNRCGGCNMALASLVVQNVKDKKDIIECENCGRILYISVDDELEDKN